MNLTIDQAEGLVRVRRMAASGDLLRLFREAGLSNREIGLAVDASPVTVHGWLHGHHKPTGRRAVGLVELVRRLQAATGDAEPAA